MPAENLLDLEQVAELLGIAPRAVRVALDDQDFTSVPAPLYQTKPSGQPRWCRSQFKRAKVPPVAAKPPKPKPRPVQPRPVQPPVLRADGSVAPPWEAVA